MGIWLVPLQASSQESSKFRKQYSLDRLSAATRYFLCRFLKGHGDEEEALRQKEDYSRDFYQSDRSVSRAIEELVGAGILLEKRTKSGVGRPSLRLSVSQDFLGELRASAADEDPLHELKIERVFTDGFPPRKGERRTRLSPANRVLLAVLLLSADKNGAVQIGMGKLGRVAGLSEDQLKSQFTKLAAEGYLRARVSGFSGRCLFGRVAGYVFLNLRHVDLGGGEGGQITIIQCFPGFGQAVELYRDSWDVHRDLRKYRNDSSLLADYPPSHYPAIKSAISFESRWNEGCRNQWDGKASKVLPKLQLDGYFQELQPSQAASYLQMRINHYASLLLTNGDFENTISDDYRVKLEDSIRGELVSPERSGVEPALKAFLTAVWQQVKSARGMIDLVKGVDRCLVSELEEKGAEYLILPMEAVLGRQHALTLQISTKEKIGPGDGSCWVIDMPGHDSQPDVVNASEDVTTSFPKRAPRHIVNRYPSEKDLSEEEQISYGLRLRGHKYPTGNA